MGARNAAVGLGIGLWLAIGSQALASGWQREEQGAKATALAQAFTAQADDPTAVYYNPAGLAFLPDRAFTVGLSLTDGLVASFHGADPVPGTGTTGERRVDPEARPHFYWVEPVAGRWSVGMGLQSAAGFETTWKDPDNWPGRFIARKSALRSWDLTAVAAVRVARSWGLAAGVVGRRSQFEWERSETLLDPMTQLPVEVALSELRTAGATDAGAVFAVAHRPPGRWSWGLRWRGSIESRFDGRAVFVQRPTGDPALDTLAATSLPFGAALDWTTRVRYPSRLTLGVAFAPAPTFRLELGLERSDWGSSPPVDIVFAGQAQPDRQVAAGWRTRMATRAGLRWNGLGNGEWRAGLFHDPTPQPDADAGPFYTDADRLGASIGYGTRVRRLQTDIAMVWEEHDKRTTTNGFDGVYRTRLLRLVLSFGW